MKITTTKKFLKKIILILVLLLSYFLYVDKPHAEVILPPFPSGFNENWTYFLSYDGGDGGIFHLTYCKSANQTMHLKTIYNEYETGNVVFIGDCYDPYGNYVGGAYHNRSTTSVPLTREQINNYNFSVDFNWRDYENQPYIGLFIEPNTRKIKTWKNYVGQIDEYTFDSVVISGNGSIYNAPNLQTEELLTPQDYSDLPSEPTISFEVVNGNGYADIYFFATGYTPTTIQDYDIKVRNLNTGNYTQETLQPVVSGSSEMSVRVYEPTNFYYYVEDKNTQEIIQEEYISVLTLEYSNFNINITNIDKPNTSITYTYQNFGNLTNFICTHQISGGQEIEDVDCTLSNNSYTINLGGNKAIIFRIYYENQQIFTSTTPFVFKGNLPYITYEEEVNGGLTSLKVFLNSYNDNNYITKYQINRGTETTPTLTQEPSVYNDKYSFVIWNLTEDTSIDVNVYDTNNNLVSASFYQYNAVKIQQIYGEDYGGVKGFFNTINISNISNELKQIIQSFGNLLMNSKIGGILITMATITALAWVLNLIRR